MGNCCGGTQENGGGGGNKNALLVPFSNDSKQEQDVHKAPAVRMTLNSKNGGKHFSDVYELGKELGSGAFSVVKEGTKRKTGESYAIKIVTIAKLEDEDEESLKDEIDILQDLQHDNIICLYAVFHERDYYYLVTEKMTGGELFDRIVQKAYYNEKEARDTCLVLFSAMGYCHSKQVAHRDLKPENLLLESPNSDSNIKIADFGFAKRCTKPNSLTTQCGTPGYVAPEILEGMRYDTQADTWSLGVIVYILLGGYPPFIDSNQRDLFRKIRKGQYEFHEEYWGQVSFEAKNFISSLLTVSPVRRLTAENALKNNWMTQSDDQLEQKNLGVNLAEFKKFNAKRKIRAAVNAVIVRNRFASLGLEFQKNLLL